MPNDFTCLVFGVRSRAGGFLHHQQIIWDKGRTVLTRRITGSNMNPAGMSERRMHPGEAKPGIGGNVSAEMPDAGRERATGPGQTGAEREQLENPVDVKAAARFLGVSPSLIYAFVERKQIPHYRMMGRAIRFRISETGEVAATIPR